MGGNDNIEIDEVKIENADRKGKPKVNRLGKGQKSDKKSKYGNDEDELELEEDILNGPL